MLAHVLILFCLVNKASDTLLLPIDGGIVKKEIQREFGLHESEGIKIYPTNSFAVKSLSSGKVSNIHLLEDGRYLLVINSGIFSYSYILDSSSMKRGQNIQKAQVIGKLKNKNLQEMDERALILSIYKEGRLIDATKFLLFK